MSHPHIIWTMRRTGGTSLAGLLQKYSPFPFMEHEPFNAGRALNAIVERFAEDEDLAAAETALREALRDRPVIKNCYDLHLLDLHALLMRITNELGYHHVVLDRDNEEDRLLSLMLAAQTGAWGPSSARDVYAKIRDGDRALQPISGPKLLQNMRRAASRRDWLKDQLVANGITPHVVFFEDIYAPEADGKELVRGLFHILGIPMEPADQFEADLHAAIHERSQGSARILPMVPNISELRSELTEELENIGNPFRRMDEVRGSMSG